MGRKCSICSLDPEPRKQVEEMLVSGASLREITGQFPDLSKSALARHRAEHMTEAIKEAHEKRIDEAASLFDRLRVLQRKAAKLLDQALEGGKAASSAPALLREAREQLKLEAQLTGELEKRVASVETSVNILQVNSSAVIYLKKNHPEVYTELRDHLREMYDREHPRSEQAPVPQAPEKPVIEKVVDKTVPVEREDDIW